MRRLAYILIVLLLSSIGCRGSDDASLSSANAQRGAAEQWLEVVSDPAALEEARQLAARLEDERFEAVCAQPPLMFVDPELIRLLKAREEEAAERLQRILDQGMSEKSVAAAMLLCRLGHQAGLLHLREVLASGRAPQRTHLMDELNFARDKLPQLRKDEAFQSSLLKQVDDSDPAVARAAIQVCGIMEVPGAAAKFAKLIHRPGIPGKERLFYWLSRLDPQPQHVEALVDLLDEADEDAVEDWAIGAVADFAECDDAETARRARQVLRKMVKRPTTRTGTFEAYDYGRLRAIELLVKHSERDDLAWLLSLREERLPWYVEAAVLGALARMEGEPGRERLLAALDDPNLHGAAAQQIKTLFSGTADREVLARLKAAARNENRTNVLAAIAEALLATGGDGARDAAVGLADRLDASSKMRILWQANGLSAEKVADQVVETGLIDRAAYLKALQEIRESPHHDPNSPIYLESALTQAGVGLAFDVETGELPCRHDLLLLDFAQASQGVFKPQAVSQQWHRRDREAEEDYTLQFIFAGRLYRAKLRNFGDWYDAGRLVTAINLALEGTGEEERFVALESEGQVAWFLFGKPEAFQKLADELYLPLGEDLNQAMRLGKEFEQRVIESLNENQRE